MTAGSSFTPPPASVTSDASDLDECEALLRRAIEMVRSPAGTSQIAKSLADERPGTSAELASFAPVHSEPPKSVLTLAEAHSERDECEAVLNRTLEMVRGAARSSRA
jgi:hypothetical protein